MNDSTKTAHPIINDSDLTRESWKVFQIMAEFVEGFEKLAGIKPSVSMFGSARYQSDHPHYILGEEVARLLSDAGFSVVSGGGPGLMEAFNKGAFAGRSQSVGLNILLPHEQGGFGTLDELAEILTLTQTGKSRRIPIILVDSEYWKGLIDWFKETLVVEDAISASDLDLIQVVNEAQQVLDAIFSYYKDEAEVSNSSAVKKQLEL
jgi:predicted Rossmann-fold nucleotide-binding protein